MSDRMRSLVCCVMRKALSVCFCLEPERAMGMDAWWGPRAVLISGEEPASRAMCTEGLSRCTRMVMGRSVFPS